MPSSKATRGGRFARTNSFSDVWWRPVAVVSFLRPAVFNVVWSLQLHISSFLSRFFIFIIRLHAKSVFFQISFKLHRSDKFMELSLHLGPLLFNLLLRAVLKDFCLRLFVNNVHIYIMYMLKSCVYRLVVLVNLYIHSFLFCTPRLI